MPSQRDKVTRSEGLGAAVRRYVLWLSLAAITGFVIVLVGGAYVSWRSTAAALRVNSEATARSFQLYIGEAKKTLLSGQYGIVKKGADPRSLFLSLLEAQHAIRSFHLITIDGKSLLDVSLDFGMQSSRPFDSSDQAKAFLTQASDHRFALAAFQKGTRMPTFLLATYTYYSDYQSPVFIMVSLDTLAIVQLAIRLSNPDRRTAFIASDTGSILVHPNTHYIGRTLDFIETRPHPADGAMRLAKGPDGRWGLACAVPIAESDWAAVNMQPLPKPMLALLALSLVPVAVVLWLVLRVNRFTRRHIVTPLGVLKHAVEKYGGGDLNPQVLIPGNGELAHLGQTLNKMARSLADTLAEMEKQKEKAETANRAKSVFLANISHELRTPLNAILGYSKLMQQDFSLLCEQNKYLDTINRSGEHLFALINDVLEISQIEAGHTALARETFDLGAMLRDLEKMFASSMDAKGLRFEIIGIDDLPQYLATDENKLRQVLVNLLDNAVKFTEQGGVTMQVAAEDGAADRMRLKVEVADTGVGIAEDELDKVFAYFEQTASGRGKKSGTGLGLALGRDFARMMGGDITVASIEGKGSTFYLNIEVGKGFASDIKKKIPERRVIGLAPGQDIPRVLVAEDTEANRTLLVEILKSVGLDVQEAVNGKQAVEMFHKWRPHFIWMDVRMPVMDGLEATRRIKQTEAGKSTPIAALTAHALEEEKEVILAAGCDDFVHKPFRDQEIFEAMAKHLGLKYVHESSLEKGVPVEPELELRPEQLAALPEDLLSKLYQAVVELDEERILVLIEKIKTIDDHLAAALDTLVGKLALSPLLDLLEKIARPKQEEGHEGA
ncbi:MAG: response regulator [Desulfobacteraceae bacterium]